MKNKERTKEIKEINKKKKDCFSRNEKGVCKVNNKYCPLYVKECLLIGEVL